MPQNKGITSLPGFYDSLKILIEDEGYSQFDVGLMFNVSRERIRQLLELSSIGWVRNLQVGLRCVRVWDDDSNRFRPMLKTHLKRENRKKAALLRIEDRKKTTQEKREHLTATLVAFHKEFGRSPTIKELYMKAYPDHDVAPSGMGARLCQNWEGGAMKRAYSEVTDEMYASAGFATRTSGARGHITPHISILDMAYCCKGHKLSEVGLYSIKQNGQIYFSCKGCRKERSKRYKEKLKMRAATHTPVIKSGVSK